MQAFLCASRKAQGGKESVELTPRLRKLADWTAQGARFADIGTDHAYLPVWLYTHGRISFGIASDLRQGPLDRAKKTGQEYQAEGIIFRLGNGLSGISAYEVDTIAIAGMGGENIASILLAAPWTRDGQHTLLLQPMTREAELRRFLMENGYAIRREALVEDRGILYPVMEACGGEMRLNLGQIYGGARLERDPFLDRYLREQIIRLQCAIAGLNRSGKATDMQKGDELREVITALLQMREECRRDNGTGD